MKERCKEREGGVGKGINEWCKERDGEVQVRGCGLVV
jgi:hypothetical protein